MTLHLVDQVPDRLLDVPARSVAKVLPSPTLIPLEGQPHPRWKVCGACPDLGDALEVAAHFCPGAPSASGGVRSTTTSIHFV